VDVCSLPASGNLHRGPAFLMPEPKVERDALVRFVTHGHP
jgi:hypothetical protein